MGQPYFQYHISNNSMFNWMRFRQLFVYNYKHMDDESLFIFKARENKLFISDTGV